MTSHGWLQRANPRLDHVEGVKLDLIGTKTRYEEFTLLAEIAKKVRPEGNKGLALDAGTGYVPDWHIAPYILAKLGWTTLAIDTNEKTLEMRSHSHVIREIMDLRKIERPGEWFHLVCCISVLEHLPLRDRVDFAREAARVAVPGGWLVVTADRIPPAHLAELFLPDFDVGELTDFAYSDLEPPVSFVIGRKI